MRSAAAILVRALAVIMIAATELGAQQEVDDQSVCPVTQPPAPRFVPRPPHPAQPQPSAFYFGSEKLWVALPYAGFGGVPAFGGWRVKFPWFADDLDFAENSRPDLSITGRRLDAKAQPLIVEGPHLAWTTTRFALTSALIFPTPGCWEITAKRKVTQIRFVVWVSP